MACLERRIRPWCQIPSWLGACVLYLSFVQYFHCTVKIYDKFESFTLGYFRVCVETNIFPRKIIMLTGQMQVSRKIYVFLTLWQLKQIIKRCENQFLASISHLVHYPFISCSHYYYHLLSVALTCSSVNFCFNVPVVCPEIKVDLVSKC